MGKRGRPPSKSKNPAPPEDGSQSLPEDREVERARLLMLRAALKEIEVKRTGFELIARDEAEREWRKIRAELSEKTFRGIMSLKARLIEASDPIDAEEILREKVIALLSSETKKAEKIKAEGLQLHRTREPDLDELASLSAEDLEQRIEEEKTRLTRAEADKRELELSQKKGAMLSYDELRETWMKRGASWRSRLLTIPPRLAKEISITFDDDEMTSILSKAIDEATRELSQYES
jgi:hypothetical protein